MGKKNKKARSNSFDYRYGTGDVGELMKRYDIEGTASYHPDMRGPGSGNENRDKEDVERDIAKAMMNDYDTRRGMEAAAMAGNKDARKFAKKGFKRGNVFEGYDVLKKLKKEHVGGGGMNGAKNIAGLTHALVKHDREKQTEDYRREFASIKDLNAMRDDLEAQEEAANYQAQPIEKSDALARAEERVTQADIGPGSIYGKNNNPAATDNPPADASKHFLYDYREKVKEKYGPLTNTERELSNAAKRVQDAYGR